MKIFTDHYDLIAVAILIAVLAIVPDTLNKSFRYVRYHQPTLVIVK